MRLQLRGVQRQTVLRRFPVVTIETEKQPELELELERLAPPPAYADGEESSNNNDGSSLNEFVEDLYTNDDTIYGTIFSGDADDDSVIEQWVEIVEIENESVDKGENNND